MKHANQFVIIVFLLLSACAHIQPAKMRDVPWSMRKASLEKINQFEINGIIGIRSAAQNLSASFIWNQSHDTYSIRLFGPLGLNAIHIWGNRQNAQILMPNGKILSDKNPERLLRRMTGYPLPLQVLKSWVLGIPGNVPTKSLAFDPYHHVSVSTQHGWRIHWLSYTAYQGQELPNRMLLENEAFKIKIIIKDWHVSY